MPTGYTHKLMESGQSFPDFVMACARAFGACVMMRDDAPDAPIPEKFEASDYSKKRAAKARRELKRLKAMTKAQRLTYGRSERARRIKMRCDWLQKDALQNKRIEEMEQSVKAWTPPTPEHEGMKEFMLEQLQISKHSLSYSEGAVREAKATRPLQLWAEAVESAKLDAEDAAKSQREEDERAASRTKWIQDLRKSIA